MTDMTKEIKLLIREDLVTKSGKARIEFLIYFEGKQYRVPIGKSIEPKYWIQNSELVDKRSDDFVKINSYLSERKQEFEKYKRKKEALEESVFKFVVQFVKYLREEIPIPNQQNTVAKILKLLKTVLRFSNRIGKYNIEDPFANYPIELGKHKEVALSKE